MGIYSSKDLKRDWLKLQSLSRLKLIQNLGLFQKRVSIDTFGAPTTQPDSNTNLNKRLSVLYPKDKYGPWQTGATWIMSLPKSYEALSLEYKVMFKEGFLFSRDKLIGGKLPGLMGGKSISNNKDADGRNGWTSRLMWGQKGRGLGYLYYPDMRDDEHNKKACPRFGQESEDCVIYRNKYFTYSDKGDEKCLSEWASDDNEFKFKAEHLYTIKQQIKMNSLSNQSNTIDNNLIGNRDGELKIWVDDKLLVDCTNIRFRDVQSLGIDAVIFSTFFGGNTAESSAHPTDEIIYFDDFIVKTQ